MKFAHPMKGESRHQQLSIEVRLCKFEKVKNAAFTKPFSCFLYSGGLGLAEWIALHNKHWLSNVGHGSDRLAWKWAVP